MIATNNRRSLDVVKSSVAPTQRDKERTFRVAVVVLNWNGWKDTLACLASLQAMGSQDHTVLVVDNASTDRSVAEIGAAFPDIALLPSGANRGFGGGCNVGIRHAMQQGAEYVWLINSDATVDQGALTAMLRVADQNTSLGAVGSVLYEADAPDHVQLWGGGRVGLWLGTSHHLRSPGLPDFVSGASMLLRCSALAQVGLFDEAQFFMYWEDTDLAFRLRKAGWQLAVAADSKVWHQQSASLGKGSVLMDDYAVRSCVRFLRRHAPAPPVSITLMLVRMLAKRLLLGRMDRVRAVWQGYRSA